MMTRTANQAYCSLLLVELLLEEEESRTKMTFAVVKIDSDSLCFLALVSNNCGLSLSCFGACAQSISITVIGS